MEVTLNAGDVYVRDLKIDVARETSTHGFDFFGYLCLGSVLSPLKSIFLRILATPDVRLEGVLTRASVDDADAAFYNEKRRLKFLLRDKFRLTCRLWSRDFLVKTLILFAKIVFFKRSKLQYKS